MLTVKVYNDTLVIADAVSKTLTVQELAAHHSKKEIFHRGIPQTKASYLEPAYATRAKKYF